MSLLKRTIGWYDNRRRRGDEGITRYPQLSSGDERGIESMGWFNKSIDCVGGVYFRGNTPPRPDEFSFLKKLGMEVGLVKGSTNSKWEIRAKHPQWGEAAIQPESDALAPTMIQHDWSLLDSEKEEARAAGVGVRVRIKATRKNLLADRKNLLRYLQAIMGGDGVIAMDLLAYRLWSRESLDDELVHDADLDISQIYVAHAVQKDTGGPVQWLHTHGLGEIGFFDFDILNPHKSALNAGGDIMRAIAYAITEENANQETRRLKLFSPGGAVAFCPVERFHRQGLPDEIALRDDDKYHRNNRAVICEPSKGLLDLFRKRPRANRFLSGPLPQNPLIAFTAEATNLMADRAKNTYPLFKRICEELSELDLPMIVKLGCRTDGGGPYDREHLWFQVHEARDSTIDATLANTPYNIAGMKEGDRGEHPVDLITDWTIMSPLGNINPRQQHVYRTLRDNKDSLKAMWLAMHDAQ